MFSSRLPSNLSPNRLSRLTAEMRRGGADLLDLTESNPTRVGLRYPAQSILDGFADSRILAYEPAPFGMAEARGAIAALEGVPVENVVLTTSTSESYSWLFKLLCDAGDEILVPQPSYPLFEHLAGLESVTATRYPLRYDGRWSIDLQALERAISGKTRAIAVVNPNNPTGSYLNHGELEALDRIASERGLALIADEVFRDYSFDPDVKRTFAVPKPQSLVFRLNGLSKMLGLPQLKLGWIILVGPENPILETRERLEMIADSYLSVGAPVQIALPSLLASRETIQNQIVARIRSNLKFLHESLEGSTCSVLHTEGGWNAVLRVPSTRSEEEWAMSLLAEQRVLVQPGYFFDFEAEAYLVLSLLPAQHIFEKGVRRLVDLTSG